MLRKCACGQYLLPGMVPRPGPELEAALALWLEVGNLEPLEHALLAGYGHMLVGRSSRLPRVATFLRNIPLYQDCIARVHEAAAKGRLTDLARLLNLEGQTWVTSRDQVSGTTPLQKAMLGQHYAAAKLLIRRAPCCLHATDRMGRTPLHYAAALDATSDTSVDKWYQMLCDAGCEENIKDLLGRTPRFYSERCSELLQLLNVHGMSRHGMEKSGSEDTTENEIIDELDKNVFVLHVTVEIHEEEVTSSQKSTVDRPAAQAA